MSLYSENYKKMMDGYTKILSCIHSVETVDQLECIPNMVDSWIALVDKYCDSIYYDKTNKFRKKHASQLGEAGKEMFDAMKTIYQNRLVELTPEEYDGVIKPTRIKGFQEIMQDYE